MEILSLFLRFLSVSAAAVRKSTAAASQSRRHSDRKAELRLLHRFPVDDVLFSGDVLTTILLGLGWQKNSTVSIGEAQLELRWNK